VLVALGDVHHEAQVGLDHDVQGTAAGAHDVVGGGAAVGLGGARGCVAHPGLDAAGVAELGFAGQDWVSRNVGQVLVYEVGHGLGEGRRGVPR
jgi:hypothetical protein